MQTIHYRVNYVDPSFLAFPTYTLCIQIINSNQLRGVLFLLTFDFMFVQLVLARSLIVIV